jgi:UDP-GlcNAc3NAcA epimerase
MKVVAVVGARPQFIKAAAVARAFAKQTGIDSVLVHTGQHYDANMSAVFFDELDIPKPRYDLGVGGGTHAQNTGRMLERIEEVLVSEKPEIVLVYGDTDSTLAGALAAAKIHIPVAHVEAGLRSFNRRMPEEINRLLTDHISEMLFTPTDTATRNLKTEGIAGATVTQTGDVMYDAALFYRDRARERSHILSREGLEPRSFVLATIHRAENTDDVTRLRNIVTAFGQSDHPVVWPVHPRTLKRLGDAGLELPASVRAIEPVGYLDMTTLEVNARLIATDSGGVQKEAYFHGVPCVTLRDETEWVELVDAGWNALASPDAPDFVDLLWKRRDLPASHADLYGAGDACERVVAAIAERGARST